MQKIAAFIFGAAALVLAGQAAEAATNFPVFFQPWSAAIDSNGVTTIAHAAKFALANPNFPIIVAGSADTVGSKAANKDMGQTRAQVVCDALVADGVPESRIAIVSTGEVTAPGSSQGSSAQFSRRVLIQIGN